MREFKEVYGLLDEKLQHILLTLYTGEQFALNPPRMEELRAKSRNFLTTMPVNPRNQSSQSSPAGYQKSTQATNVAHSSGTNAKDGVPSKNNWTQAPKVNIVSMNRDRGSSAFFDCGEEENYMKECRAQRASLNKMGYAPPPDMMDPQELDAYYKEVSKFTAL